MPNGTNLAAVAALIGDPARANMLEAVLDGRHLTAGELAHGAGVAAATASGHLAKLTDGGLMVVARQGRHRYYGLASAEIAKMLEGILVVGRGVDDARSRATPRVPAALIEARTCYDHLAGRLAVAIADALVDREAIELTPEAGEVTERGRELLAELGMRLDPPRGKRRFCRPCLDWSERRPHLAGVVGAEILRVSLERNWVCRQRGGRAIDVTPAGRRAFAEYFGVPLPLAGAER